MQKLLQIGILLIIISREATISLKLWKFAVPPLKFRGDNVELECAYELNNSSRKYSSNYYNNNRQHYRKNNHMYYDNEEDDEEKLYAVKWYKDNEEFYRYVPRANPPQHSYKVDGIRVDHKLSDSMRVFLRSVTLKSSGLYRCEVSAEAPSFASVQREGYLEVVFISHSLPIIQGDSILTGDNKLSLNCTSGKSYPASKLQWYINDEPIINPKYIVNYPEVNYAHGLITSSIGLKIRVNPKYFEHGSLRVKCVATVSPTMWNTQERANDNVLQQQLKQFKNEQIPLPSIDTKEVTFLVKSSAINLQSGFLILSLQFIIISIITR